MTTQDFRTLSTCLDPVGTNAFSRRVIVALDVPNKERARDMIRLLLPTVRYVKVGMELFYREGTSIIGFLKDYGLKIFLDLKIHDIPNTAERACRNLSRLGVDMFNIHCAGGLEMIKAAREGAGEDALLIGVTQLTSIDQATLNDQLGVPGTVEEAVLRYTRLAYQGGLNGVVCSPKEVPIIKKEVGTDFITVTPGVRPKQDGLADQKRVTTPKEALRLGADFLVIGRPIIESQNPKESLERILGEMEGSYDL